MQKLQNFGPGDVQNGTLAQMFHSAGINDVNKYIGDARNEPIDQSDEHFVNNQSNPSDVFLNNAQDISHKNGHGKNILGNAKHIYQLCKSLDKNGDGKITVEDVEIILKEMGLGFVSKHLARALFDIVDTNHNGQLDFRDLLVLTSLLKRLSSSSSMSSDRF